MLSNEYWKDIEGYEGLYQVSNLGRVKSLRSNKILKQQTDKNGYKRVILSYLNKQKCFQVHRLVAIAFILNTDDKPTVNHEDGNKENNLVSNLSWATNSEQTKHAIKNKLIDLSKRDYKSIIEKTISKTRKPIVQYDINGNLIKRFIGINVAKRETGINNIEKCLSGERQTAGGYIWKYESEVN
jgi:hypothetical protein